jgi:hypothetical protein
MSELRPENYYPGNEHHPILRAQLFTDSGQLSELGRYECRRICRIILHEQGLPVALKGSILALQKFDQSMELQEPDYLQDDAVA